MRSLCLFTVTALFVTAGLAIRSDVVAARCTASLLEVWPRGNARDVPPNTGIVIVAGSLQRSDGPLGGLAVRAATDTVPLQVVVDELAGDGARSQRTLVLRPVRALRPNTNYRFAIALGDLHIRRSFRTGATADVERPRFTRVVAGAFENTPLGCGPAQLIPLTFDGLTDDRDRPLFVRIRITAPGQPGTVVGEVVDEIRDRRSAFFGHGMCSGNWPLEPGDRFDGQVTVMDGALNQSDSTALSLEAR